MPCWPDGCKPEIGDAIEQVTSFSNREPADFFTWSGFVLKELGAAGLDLERYNRVHEAIAKASARFK
jgi:hypothetical protein